MKDYNYLFDKNIEINLTANNSSMINKDQINITSIKQNLSKPYNYNLLLPSYNQRHYKDEKSSSLINKNKVVKKNEFFEENDNYENKISKINSKFSTCNNYYPRKNYNKFLNSHQQIHSSSLMNNNNVYQQNVTFEGSTGYNRLNTRDLIEITKRRKEIIEHQKLKEEEKKRMMENNLNNFESIDIADNKNSNRSNIEDKNYCDEGVQTSLLNINFQENENNNNNNKKDEPLSTIIFTDKSALINQEITFLSIQYSIKNNEDNSNDIKEYKNIDNDLVNLEYNPKESIQKDKDKDKDKYNDFNNDNENNNKSNNKNDNNSDKLNDENFDIIMNNDNEDKNEIIDSYSISQSDVKKSKNIDMNKNDDNLSSKKVKNENNCETKDFKEENKCGNLNKESDLEFTIINNNQKSPQKVRNEEDNFMSNKKEIFQIESNDNALDTKDNNFTLTNNDVNINKINNFNEEVKILSDSMEVSNENISNTSLNNINESNSEENELTEIEEYDQNLIFLQNESKTMSSHFDKIKKNKNGNEESQEGKKSNKNKHNILIKDDFNTSKDNFGNHSKTVDLNKEDSLNEVLPSFETKVDYENKNEDLYNNYSKCDYKENLFRSKGKKCINSINKYDDYPTLRNIKDNNSQITRLYNNKNNLTNNNRYQNKNQNYEGKDVECFELLKLKKSDLKQNNQEEQIIVKPLKKSNNNDSIQNIKSCNEPKNNFQNVKFSSHKKLNTNIPDKNKNNISGIPINPSKARHNTHFIENLESNINVGIKHPSLKNSNGNNYLITPRCFKKKRQLNNYSEYYKLKMSMNKCDKSENNAKNYKSLGHKKSTESFNK